MYLLEYPEVILDAFKVSKAVSQDQDCVEATGRIGQFSGIPFFELDV